MAGAGGSLVGRVCMVTGATGALGKATASELARRGATVVAVARDEGRGGALLATVRQASGAGSGGLLMAGLSHPCPLSGLVEGVWGLPHPPQVPFPPPARFKRRGKKNPRRVRPKKGG